MQRLGQETPLSTTVARSTRPPTAGELSLWDRAQRAKRRALLWGYAVRLQYEQIIIAHKFAADRDVTLKSNDMPSFEQAMRSALLEIESLRMDMCDVEAAKLGVAPSAGGGDLDIIRPTAPDLGAIWIPIAIGVVVVAGIVARWAFLETEVQRISDHYNGVLRRADQALCKDPSSQMCHDWKDTKQKGAYAKNQSLLDSVKSAVGKVGGGLKTGLGAGLMLAIPLALMYLLPKRKDQ